MTLPAGADCTHRLEVVARFLVLLELYRQGKLKLDELITQHYTLDTLNDGYADMRAGRNIRGVVTFGGS